MQFNTKEQCVENFNNFDSKFLKSEFKGAEKYPLTNLCTIYYACSSCKVECSKQWRFLIPKNNILALLCSKCSKLEKQKCDELKKKAPEGQQYCVLCKNYKMTEMFDSSTENQCIACCKDLIVPVKPPPKKYKPRVDNIQLVKNMLEEQGSYLFEDIDELLSVLEGQNIDITRVDIDNYFQTRKIIQAQKMWIRCKNSDCLRAVFRTFKEFDLRSSKDKYYVGPLCEICAKKYGVAKTRAKDGRIQKISIAKKLNEENKRIKLGKTYEITDPLTQKKCTTCKYAKHIDEFTHRLYQDKKTSICIDCRTRIIPSYQKSRKRRFDAICTDETKQKCTACLRIRDKTMFVGGNKNCEICRNQDRKSTKQATELAKSINLKNEDTRMCVRCWKTFEKNVFETKTGHIGSLCGTCMEDNEYYKSLYKQQYYDYKCSRGPCVDCGETNVRILDFDHIDQNTKCLQVSQCESLEQLKKEAEKCVMRCGICHVRRTKIQCNYSDANTSDYKSRLEKKTYIKEQKIKIGGCAECKWFDSDLLEALHFDHLEPSNKISNVGTMIIHCHFSIEDIKNEIEKCQLLCVNCHRLKTLKQNGVNFYDIAENQADNKKIKVI